MYIVNKNGAEDSLGETSHPKCFKTTNFDSYIPITRDSIKEFLLNSPKIPWQISNSDYAITKFWLYVSYLSVWFPYVKTSTQKHTALVMLGQRRKCLSKDG